MQKRCWTGCRGEESEIVKDEAKQRDDIKESVNKVIKCVSEKLTTGKYAPLEEADVIRALAHLVEARAHMI